MSSTQPPVPRAPVSGVKLAAAGTVLGGLTTLSTQLVEWWLSSTSVPDNIQTTMIGLTGLVVGAVLATTGSWGRDQVDAGNTGWLASIAAKVGCVALLFWTAGCVHYSQAAYSDAAARGQVVAEITTGACEDHGKGRDALSDGPDRALKVPLGRGAAIEEFREIHDRQEGVCEAAVGSGVSAATGPGQTIVESWQNIWDRGDRVVRGE